MSILTKEVIQKILNDDWLLMDDCEGLENCTVIKELARMALAAMDSEPVAWTWQHLKQWHVTNDEARARDLAWDGVKVEPLYRHAQQPVVQPVMFIDGDISSEDADKLAKVIREFNEEDERPLAKMARMIRENPHPTNECDMPKAQPSPVVPDDVLDALQKVARIRLDMNDFDGDRRGIADCLGDAEEALIEVVNRRAAMLQAEPVCTCPSGDGSLRWPCPAHPGNSPVIGIDLASGPDRTVEVSYVAPPGYVMVPKELTCEMDDAAWEAYHNTRCMSDIWDALLSLAPHSPGSEPATVPGKWIPVSERLPDEGDHVLVSDGVGMEVSWIRGREWKKLRHIYSEDVTHWMPLPAAPQEDKP